MAGQAQAPGREGVQLYDHRDIGLAADMGRVQAQEKVGHDRVSGQGQGDHLPGLHPGPPGQLGQGLVDPLEGHGPEFFQALPLGRVDPGQDVRPYPGLGIGQGRLAQVLSAF